jgi:hypothetical protein
MMTRLSAAISGGSDLTAIRWLMLVLCAAACGAADENTRPTGFTPPSQPGNGFTSQPELATCGARNRTDACQCQNGAAGRRVCDGTTWGMCECAAASGTPGTTAGDLAGNQRTDITFSWERTATSADVGGCLPGDYEGTFGGIYWSYIATIGPIEKLAVPVANIALPGEPSGFHFTVEPAEGGETVLKIKGRMDGTADGVFPFAAALEGELDCRTKKFSARMFDGRYSVLIDGIVAQQFLGVMWGNYDVRTHTFVDGEWDVWEVSGAPPGTQAPMLPREFDRDGFGGYGTWASALPTNLNDPKIGACPMDFECAQGPLGPNKLLCNSLLGPPGCITDADCDMEFPGRGVGCLKATAFSTCMLECRP